MDCDISASGEDGKSNGKLLDYTKVVVENNKVELFEKDTGEKIISIRYKETNIPTNLDLKLVELN